MSSIKLLEMKPKDYKKEGYNFISFVVNLKDLIVDGTLYRDDFDDYDDVASYVREGSRVSYKNRECVVRTNPIMCGRNKDRSQKWQVQLILITNDPRDYVI